MYLKSLLFISLSFLISFSYAEVSTKISGEVISASDINGLQNQLKNLPKVYGGEFGFTSGNCTNPTTEACSISLVGGNFTEAPNCTLSMKASDTSGYHEHMVIATVSKTELRIWRGNYYNSGTTMHGDFTCVQNGINP